MNIVKGYFDDIHFPECKIESFEITQDSIIVNFQTGLEIYPPHPLAATSKFEEPCRAIFKRVKYSKRIFYEYNQGQSKYVNKHLFTDKFPINNDSNVEYSEYLIEGWLIKPQGWIDWEITAVEFYVDDLKN
ncbi:hypothetical protein [Nostoc sp. PCC 9305]|uniref:hypothetical protein n=1 Tax=Nostoc sp. PCC 9305 TaxID=296636 RepID=UPI0039C5B47C